MIVVVECISYTVVVIDYLLRPLLKRFYPQFHAWPLAIEVVQILLLFNKDSCDMNSV